MDALRRTLIASPVFDRLRAVGTPVPEAERLAFEFADTFGEGALICVGDHDPEHAAYEAALQSVDEAIA